MNRELRTLIGIKYLPPDTDEYTFNDDEKKLDGSLESCVKSHIETHRKLVNINDGTQIETSLLEKIKNYWHDLNGVEINIQTQGETVRQDCINILMEEIQSYKQMIKRNLLRLKLPDSIRQRYVQYDYRTIRTDDPYLWTRWFKDYLQPAFNQGAPPRDW